ncbi:MAG: DbpA RNA binding domain-containing protein [Treponema sp.]|nr:DbpA RNA binding domain-containing protein [Treponema sp.]
MVKTEVDPRLLNEYRALFKREVSFFRRSWTAACLLMLYDQGGLRRSENNRNRKSGGSGRGPDKKGRAQDRKAVEKPSAGEAARSDASRYPPLADEESKRLFISIGRNRRVFPREILGLINAKTAIPREDIGAIRILDNYSFVQVRNSAADTIIEALNGQSFRGRLLSVNYARARKDDAEDSREPAFFEIHGDDDGSGIDAPEPDLSRPAAEQDSPPEMDFSDQGEDHADEEDIEADSRQ